MARSKLSRRQFLAVAAGALGASALASCQGPTPTPVIVKETVPVVQTKQVEKIVTATPVPKGQWDLLTGTLSIAMGQPAPNKDGSKSTNQLIWEKITEAYKAKQPGVKLEYTWFPEGASVDDLYQWVQTRQASKKVPTMVGTTGDNVNAAQEAQGIAPWVAIDSYLAEVNPYTNNIWKDDQDYPLIRWRSAYQGRKYIYGMTPVKYKASWMYNKTMFDKLGLKEPKSWTEWFAVNDKLVANGIVPLSTYGMAFAWSHYVWMLMGCLGKKDFDAMAESEVDFPSYEHKLEWIICNKWTQDRPWVREAYQAGKKLYGYSPKGVFGMTTDQTTQMFMQGKSAMMLVDQGWLTVIDAAKKDKTIDFDVDAFPTPQPDEGIFSKDVLAGAGKIADDGENMGNWAIAAASVREDKSENQVKMAVDFERFLTTPEIQALYADMAYQLPVNPNVKFKDQRIASWLKNPEQIRYRWHFYGDRPTWFNYFQAYVDGKMTLDQFITTENDEVKKVAQTAAKEAKYNFTCS